MRVAYRGPIALGPIPIVPKSAGVIPVIVFVPMSIPPVAFLSRGA